MPDIRLVQSGVFPEQMQVTIDWYLRSDGSLDDTQALATAVILALGTDHLAGPSDTLPDPDSSDRRGWWGDLDAEEIWGGWPIGTRLWLMRREKIVGQEARDGATTTRIEYYVRETLQPFVQNRICSRFDVKVQRVDLERIDVLIRIYRGPIAEIDLRYQLLWNEMPITSRVSPYP